MTFENFLAWTCDCGWSGKTEELCEGHICPVCLHNDTLRYKLVMDKEGLT